MTPDTTGSGKAGIRFQFATLNHWIEGVIPTHHRRLVDALNVVHTGVIVAEQVYIRSYRDVHAQSPLLDFVNVNAAAILFAMPTDETGIAPPPRDPHFWVKKRPEPVVVGVGPYELVGQVYLPEEDKLRDVLIALRDHFIAVAKPTIRRVDDPLFMEELGVAFVNRDRIDFVCPLP